MPVSFGQNIYFEPYLSSETYSRKYEKLLQMLLSIYVCESITEKSCWKYVTR